MWSRKWSLALFALTLAVAAGGGAEAAGPFDGNWKGQANANYVGGAAQTSAAGVCVATVTAKITNDAVEGTLAFPRSKRSFKGKIAQDGSFKSDSGDLTGKFAGGTFSGRLPQLISDCSEWRVTLRRS